MPGRISRKLCGGLKYANIANALCKATKGPSAQPTEDNAATAASEQSAEGGELFVCLEGGFRPDKIIEDLKAGSQRGTQKVRIASVDDYPIDLWDHSKISFVFDVIGSLPGLEEIVIGDCPGLPITCVTRLLLKSSARLRRLKFDGCSFLATPLGSWDGSFRQLSCLESFEMTGCSQKRLGSKEPLPGLSLLSELASLPSLKRLVLGGEVDLPVGTQSVDFAQSLEGVELGFKLLPGPLFQNAIRALRKLPCLRRLSFDRVFIDKAGEQALVEWLSSNPPLQQLKMVPLQHRDGNTRDLHHALADALVQNTHLRECLVLATGCFQLPVQVLERWLFLVQHENHVLERVRLAKTSLRMQVRQLAIMEKQSPCFELEEVHVGTTAEEDERLLDLQIRIAYHLRLNASGRRRLLRDYGFVPKDVLVDVLGNCSDNVPCLYYFLKLNPEIVDAH